jgi:valyl-tRNA synthetase
MSEIPKAYEPQAVEDKWYQFWLDQKCFVADPARVSEKRPAYSIVIPPPNVTGMLHMGHVLNNTLQDILARKARMDGKEVLWLPGTDHAGIATQVQVEKALRKEEGKTKHDLGREEFLKRVWAWKEKHGGIIIQQLKKLGCSCDWTRERFTMDPEYSRCVQKVFVDLYKKGRIYRGKRMVNWDPAARTALSDEEVEMVETKGHLWHLKYPRLDAAGQPIPDQFVIVATTRPETMLGDEAVAVNPRDERYTKLVGTKVLLPLQNKPIPIIADDFVDPKFGTGCVKVTPAHDPNDYAMALRHKLPLTVVIGPDGRMTPEAGGGFAGLDRMEARKAVVAHLEQQGLLLKVEDYVHNVGHSQRSHVPVEPMLSEQWFLKYPAVKAAKECVLQSGNSEKMLQIVTTSGKEFPGRTIRELRKSALQYAQRKHFLGVPFKNEDSGIAIRVGRQSLSHAFSHLGVNNILAVAVLPELIRKAVWMSSAPHDPPNPMFKQVHRFIAALSVAGELNRVRITAKEFWDGTVLYDHQAEKITLGGKSLEAHPREGKLDTQPSPSAGITLGALLADVNVRKMRFHPDRWAKVYDHWLTNIQDWCISRQLWWGHRIPVWNKSCGADEANNWREVLSKYEDERQIRVIPIESGEIIVEVATISDDTRKLIQSAGFAQDPDVLDTWFSSWLWPFATMGWTGDKDKDARNETLQKFYPTTDLVTGPDIIFFWVARMIMAGYEFMGELPFRNVYFTGIIRDKQGRKMSKTLGNSPDPLELIAKYGADALRFGTMRSAPLGQDVLFDEKDVELGRNFCNKLWNACRFRQMQGGDVQGEINPSLLTNDDKWILLKLNQAIKEITQAFAEYKFNEATATLYRFFWSEYCDWYVEASKATLVKSEIRNPKSETEATEAARRANTLAVIDFVLSHTLRLFHPFLPFITEELWHGMGYAQDMPENQGGRTIMNAPWPKPFDADFRDHYGLDDCYLEFAEQKYEVVTQGRNLRRIGNIPAGKKARFILRPDREILPHDAEVMRILLHAEALELNGSFTPKKGTPTAHTPLGELFLPLEGLVDVEAEKARLKKEVEKAEAEIAKVEQKLANPNFTQKVPPQVLQDHQQRLVEWQGKLAHAKAALEALGG